MEILPIRYILDEDAPLIGANFVNLGKLYHHKIPIADGIIITPPKIVLNTILQQIEYKNREIFEQKIDFLKSEINKITPSDEIVKILREKDIKVESLWPHLLEFWFLQIRSIIWREGFISNITSKLSSKAIYFINKVNASGHAYYNSGDGKVNLTIEKGVLSKNQEKLIAELVNKSDKVLYVPHVYEWVTDSDKKHPVKIVAIQPYTPKHDDIQNDYNIQKNDLNTVMSKVEKITKSSTKLFVNNPVSNDKTSYVDGIIFSGEKIINVKEKYTGSVAYKYLQDKLVIYKLSDIRDNRNIRGTLRLNHDNYILEENYKIFNYIKTKLKPSNVNICLPYLRSVTEYITLKEKLSKLGIKQSANLKFWLEFAVPENILNFESYISEGFDGIILNLDELSFGIGGYFEEGEEKIFYGKQVTGLLKFIKNFIKDFHKANIPIIASGNLVLHDDVLMFLIENGIWGVSMELPDLIGIVDHVKNLEKKVVTKANS